MSNGLLLCAMIVGALATGVFASSMAQHLMCKDVKLVSRFTVIVLFLNVGLWCALYFLGEGGYDFVLGGLVASALLCLSVVDTLTYEIPPQINLFIVGVGVVNLILDLESWPLYVIGAFAVSGIFFIIALCTKGRGMGGGDIKLMAALGFYLGWKKILLVMVLGCILGAVIHSILMAVTKKQRMLAFGPYLSAAGVIVMLWGEQMIEAYVSYILPNSSAM